MSRRASIWRAWLAGACLLVAACGGVDDGGSEGESCELTMPGPDEEMFERLDEYCFFGGDPAAQHEQTSQGVVPYGVRSNLYSDRSDKFRFVVLPDGEKIAFDETEMWGFPEGTIIVKTFYFPDDARQPDQGRRLLETRLLRKLDGAWEPAVYKWNEAQTEATRHAIGADVTVEWIDEEGKQVTTNYRVPDENKCKSCHAKENEVTLLGPRTRQLNRTYAYAEGRKNQIAHFADEEMFEGEVPAPEQLSRLPDPKNEELSIEKRARAYLEGNCAHCHRPGGGASNSALFVNWRQEDRRSLGICKEPPAAGGGTGGYEYSIKPGHPDESIMVHRMKSSEPDIKMPELPLRTVDEFGVRIVSEWIAQMEPAGCERDGG